ncbi:hypothetical protein D9615_004775 [Tricholomella constricta]|uniref:Uncharacterized protein n=1 Tax=Tricholomella constricta TaxID=117010 RepID=A0A8H5HHG3_9AGAR|nr:hypothetical protein D9615_004775 [Tricholomella constricta]
MYLTTDSGAVMTNLIAPFVNRHHLTLRAIHITSPPSDYKLDISPLLHNLRYFPNLTTLSVVYDFISIHQSPTSELTHFLSMHADQLQEYALHIRGPVSYDMHPDSDDWDRQEFLRTPLPHLKKLDLSIELFPSILCASKHLEQFAGSLTSLILSHKHFSYLNIESIVDVFSDRDLLRHLVVSIDFLSPQLLALLATKLPGLEAFSCEYKYLSSDPSNLFRREPSLQAWRRWKLRELVAQPNHTVPAEVSAAFGKAVREAVPGLRTLSLTGTGVPLLRS